MAAGGRDGTEAVTQAHLLIIIARMIGNQPNLRISMMGGLLLAVRTHTGVRAMRPMQTSGATYRLSGKRKRRRKGTHAAVWPGPEHTARPGRLWPGLQK